MEKEVVRVHGERFEILGLLGSGDYCDVWWARRLDPVELVVIKVGRGADPVSLDRLVEEGRVLKLLRARPEPENLFFHRLIPSLVVSASAGNWEPEDPEGPFAYEGYGAGRSHANVYRYLPGFVHTFRDIAEAYPEGIRAEASIWMWKRVLDQLGWLHSEGWVHANVTPDHVLVHARDHGTILAGWSRVTRIGAELQNPPSDEVVFYPRGVLTGDPCTPETDITMSARCVFHLLGGEAASGKLPSTVPGPLARLVQEHALEGASGRISTARQLHARVTRVAEECFGRPRFQPFTMPA